jgi:acyl transferase domain-containing protein/aryl carrier-like protein
MWSTVTGQVVGPGDLDADYWVRNLRQPVRLLSVVETLLRSEHDVFVELGPHPVLLTSIAEITAGATRAVALPSARRDQAVRTWLESVGALHAQGLAMQWSQVLEPAPSVPLPPYPWQRQRFWFEGTPGAIDPAGAGTLLAPGRPFEPADRPGTRIWEIAVGEQSSPWLADHRVRGRVVVPAAFYLAYVANALGPFANGVVTIDDAEFLEPLLVDGPLRLQLVVRDGSPAPFECHARPADAADAAWQLHARGHVSAGTGGPGPDGAALPEMADVVPGQHLYERLWARGLEYGPAFQGVRELHSGGDVAMASVAAPDEIAAEAEQGLVHPAVLDAALHAIAGCSLATEGARVTYVPTAVRGLRLFGRVPPRVDSLARLDAEGGSRSNVHASLRLIDRSGVVVLSADRFVLRALAPDDRAGDAPGNCLFEIDWQAAPRATAAPRDWSDDRAWLLLADQQGVARELADLLRRSGQAAVLALAGEADLKDPDEYVVDPENPGAMSELIDRLFTTPGRTCHGIVHLWSVDVRAADPDTVEGLVRAQWITCAGAWSVLQAVSAAPWETKPRLWLVTAGAQSREPGLEPIFPAQAPLWGLGHTAAHEHPEYRCTRVDLSEAATPDDVASLAQELWSDSLEDRVLLRDDRRYVARLVPSRAATPSPVLPILVRRGSGSLRVRTARTPTAPSSPAPVRFRDDGAYLVTGGLGGLGLKVAAWMADRGAGGLVLAGRRPPGPDAREAIDGIRARGVEVLTQEADVSSAADVTRLFDTIDRGSRPLAGIIHAAGVLDDGLLLDLDWAQFRRTLAPKLDGAWLLHQHSLQRPLDLFVLFSSIASVLGSPGQANYAAANAFLDGLAAYRRALGLPAQSINWGPWEEVGLAATQPERARREAEARGESTTAAEERPLLDRLTLRGMASFTPEYALELFEQVLQRRAAQVAVMSVDWAQFLRFYPEFASQPSFSLMHDVVALRRSPAGPGESPRRLRLRDDLAAARADDRLGMLVSRLAERVARTVGLLPEALDVDQPFTALGLDSLMAVELRNWLSQEAGVTVPVVRLLRGPTLRQFAGDVLRDLKLPIDVPAPSA